MLRDDEEDGGRPPLYRGGLIHHPRPATTQHMLMQSHLHDVSTIDLMIALPYALSPALPHEEAWSRCRHAALNRIFNPIMATHMSCRGVGAMRSRLEQLIVQARHTLRETQSASRLCAFDLLAARVDAPGGVRGDASAQRSRCMNHDSATTSNVRGILKATSQTDDIQQQQQNHDGDDLSLAQKLLYVVLRTSAVDHRDDAIRQPSSSSSSSSSSTFTTTNKERLSDANEGAAKHWCIEPFANSSWPSTSSSLQKTSSPTTTTTSFSMMMKPSTCWLSPSMIFILERSGEMRDALRWSTDPDLIVLSVLTQSSSPHNNISSAWMMDNHGSAPSITSATTSEWGSAESSDVVRLVGDAPRRRRASSTSMKRLASTTRVAVDPTPANNNNTSSNHTDIRKRPHAALFSMMSSVYSDVCGILFVALHRCVVGVADPYQLTEVVERNTSSPTSCEVFMTVAASFLGSPNHADDDDDDAPTMHARVVALQRKISADVPRKRRKRDAANPPTPSKTTTTTATSMNAASSPHNEDHRLRHRACTRGVMAMLQWGCSCGTLFLRLQHLCVLAEQPHQRVGLGVYGVCAVAALRTCLAVLRRQAVELSVRPGGPHGIRFSELIDAYQRLEHVEEGVMVLANYFHVRASGDYDARDAIRRLSSATLLSEGFSHFSARCINSLGRYQYGVGDCHAQVEQMEMERAWREQQPSPTTAAREDESSTARCVAAANYVNRANHLSASIDVLGHLFTSLLAPFHRMTQTWMQHGRLADQLDEFFIVPSYGSTASGFMIDASTHRLPCFVSVDAAEAVLQAGISRRVVRAAAAHLVEAARLSEVACRRAQQGACANDEMMEECEYDDAHHHQQQHPSRRPCAADAHVGSWLVEEFLDALDGRRVSPFPALPRIDPVDERGTLRYWRAFHGACNTLLLSRVEAELKEARAEVVADMAKTTKQKKSESEDVRHSVPASVSAAHTPQEDNEEAPLAEANTCASEDDSHISIEVVMNDEDEDDDVGMLAPPRTSTDDYVEIFLDGLSVAPLAENEDEDEEEEPIHSATASTASSVLGLRRVVPQRSGSSSTLSSQSSHAASALYGAIAEEMRQVAIVREDVEEASMHVKHAMQHTYTQDVRHFCWMKRMKAWKDQRMALCPLRSAAVRQTVDELRALYDAHTSTLGDDGDEEGSTQRLKFVVPFSRCPSPTPPPVELFPTLADESSKTKHVGVSFLVPKSSSSSSSSRHEKDEEMMQMEEEPPCTDINRWANEVVPVTDETNATSIRGGTLPEAAHPHLAAAATTTSPALLDEAGLPHPAECYVVDDINDEEYFQQRVGPTSHRRAEYEALMAHMAEMEAHMQTVDVHSSFYRNFCSSIARQRLGLLAKEEVGTSTCNEDEDAPQHCGGVAGLPSSVATAATRASAWDDDDPRIAERTWSSDATSTHNNNKNTTNSTDEPATSWPRTHVLGDDELGATLTETMRLTPAAAEALQSCGAYLHIIAQHNAMYMTHKALQLALLPPHGSIFQVLQQMMNVCLLQGGGLVFGLLEMWDRRVEAALDSAASPHHHHNHHHHPVDAWATLSELNEVFGAAWSASLVGGAGRSVEVAWVLSEADARNGATLARARMLDEMGWEAEEEESMMMMMDDGGDDAHDHHVAVPSNLFEFIACLTLRCQRACGGMWLLPQGVVEDVGDVCSTLLLWKTLERVVLRTWRAGMDSGMPEVFFFCNVARQTFTSLQQHTWHTISSVVKSYRASLELLSGVLYAFHALSEFTAATELFLAELRLAAILAEPLCSCWDPIYVMLRELEEVERVARFVARERRSAMLYHRNAMDAIAALAEDVVAGGGGIARSKDALAAVRLAQSLIARTAPVPLAADVAVAGVPPPLSDQEMSSMLHDSTTQHDDDDDASLPPPPPRKRTGGKRRLAKSASTSTKERRSRKTKRLSPTAPTHVKVGWRGGTSATVATDRRAVVRRLRPSRSNNVASGTTTKTNTHVDATRGTTFGGAAKRRLMKGVVPRLQRETTMILEEELQRQRNVAHAAIATRLCSFGTTLERLVEYLDEARDALNAEDAVQRFFQTSTADEVERGEDADAHRGSSRMEEAKMWRQQKQAAQRLSTSIASLTAQLQLTLSAIHVKTRTEGSDG